MAWKDLLSWLPWTKPASHLIVGEDASLPFSRLEAPCSWLNARACLLYP